MAIDIVPANFWRLPMITSDLLEDLSDLVPNGTLNGLSVSEDDKKVYVEAALPGLDPQDIEVSFDKGTLMVRGEVKTEEEGKKYYRKATRSFAYRVSVPGEVDWSKNPSATIKNGVMTVTFLKTPEAQPKRIPVKAE
ncbi:MAG: Hsp20/alpha crystallin family protein [Candidatus Levyibacteriota bacterium]